MSRANGRLTVLRLSDVHATRGGLLYDAVDGVARLRAVGDYVRQAGITPEAIVVTGDLVQRGHGGAYDAVDAAFQELEQVTGVPVLTVIGNHDDAAAAHALRGHGATLLQYTPADVDALNPDVVDAEGYYTGTRIIPTVIAYNTGVITEAPQSWAELTDAKYADQIVMPNPDVSGAAAYNAAVWLDEPELGEEWMSALAENRPVIADSNGPVSQAVATGAQPVGIVVDYLVRELAAQGSPIAVSYPSEGVPFVSQPVGIFADTDAVEASQAFVDFLVSEAGQRLAVEQSYLPVRSDVGTPDGAPAMDEISILAPDLETIRSSQDAAVEKFRELFL